MHLDKSEIEELLNLKQIPRIQNSSRLVPILNR